MTNTETTHTDESGPTDLATLPIGELRKYAKMMGISAQRDWTTKDFVVAIEAVINASKFIGSAAGGKSTLPPGHARLIIFKDPTPGHSNSPIPIGLNMRTFIAPRGVEIVMPLEYVGVLHDARSSIMNQREEPSRNKPNGEVIEEVILSYPFQVLELSPHANGSGFSSQHDQRATNYRRRLAFREEIGKWPTSAEMLEWEKEQRQNRAVDNHIALKSK